MIPVTPQAPVCVDTDAVVGWSSSLQTTIQKNQSLKSILRGGSGELFQLALSGPGLRDRPAQRGQAGAGAAEQRRRHPRQCAERLRNYAVSPARSLVSQAAASAKSSVRQAGGAAGRRIAVGGAGIGTQEPHVRTDPPQALERLAHLGVGDVAGAVQEEDIPPEAASRSGRDSMRVMFTPRTESSVSTASSAPTRSWAM